MKFDKNDIRKLLLFFWKDNLKAVQSVAKINGVLGRDVTVVSYRGKLPVTYR